VDIVDSGMSMRCDEKRNHLLGIVEQCKNFYTVKEVLQLKNLRVFLIKINVLPTVYEQLDEQHEGRIKKQRNE